MLTAADFNNRMFPTINGMMLHARRCGPEGLR
jgi:hypothetical protein